ncbi:hypothetical protein ACF0H5_012570 [Mactra antiquata]
MKFGYVIVVGLSILQLIQASNTTDEFENSTQSSIYVQDRVATWLEGLKDCERDEYGSNETYKFLENSTYIADLVDTHGPLWTNGMEVVADHNGKKEVFRIYQRYPDLKATCVCWSKLDPSTTVKPNLSFSEAKKLCYTKNNSLPIIHPGNVTQYNSLLYQNSPFWIHSIQEELFLNASDIEVRCYIYDVGGILKTENCRSKYKTLCVRENAFHVLEFVNNVTLPRLQTKSTTVFMDPQIQYTVIGVGAAIVIAIVVAILICCCKRKKKMESSEERKSTQLADNYSETVDSMAMKEQVVYETPNNSEYATPDDAIRKARQRQSIGENEYDVINSDPKKKKPTGGAVHAYNHVTLVSTKDKQSNSDLDENQYDVTNYGRQATVLIAPNDKTENEYMSINVEK